MAHATTFVLTLFVVTWGLGFFWHPPAPETVWGVLVQLLPSVWAPTVIAVLLNLSTVGAGGAKKEISARLRYKHGMARWLAIAGAVPIVSTLAAVYADRAAGDSAPSISSAAIFPMIGLQLATGAVGEELGWRGYLLPRLGIRFGPLAAAFVMAALWSLWHVPAFFNPMLPHRTMPFVSTLLAIGLFGVFLGIVFSRAGDSVLATIVAHLSFNVMLGLGRVQLSSRVFWRTLAAIFGTLALVSIVSGTRGLSATGAPCGTPEAGRGHEALGLRDSRTRTRR